MRAPAIFDFEICLPVSTPVAPSGRVRAAELDAGTVAQTVYHGAYEGLAQAWGELEAWLASEKLSTASDVWERYVVGNEAADDPAAFRTELNQRLRL